MLSSTLLTLLVIPAIYMFVKRRGLRAGKEPAAARQSLKQAAE
jgi:hypothetical protein